MFKGLTQLKLAKNIKSNNRDNFTKQIISNQIITIETKVRSLVIIMHVSVIYM